MEFQLMNAEIYTGFTDEKDVEEILARLNPTNFNENKPHIASYDGYIE